MCLIAKTKAGVEEFIFTDTGEVISPKYIHYSCPENYKADGLIPIEPMTAKEEDREEELEKMLNSPDYYVEEKFDGTRGLLYFIKDDVGRGHTRVFSRRISVQTGWYCENTDSLPHIHRIDCPDLEGTVIDGELFIPGRPFKDVSSTLNCKWDKAIERQIQLGLIVFHAFDIIFYKGVYIARMPLWKRKQYLQKVVDRVNSPFIKMVQYSGTTLTVPASKDLLNKFRREETFYNKYPELYEHLLAQVNNKTWVLSKKAYYEYVVANGGEGVIIKDKSGKYYHKRGREYIKLKKFLTREVIIMGFTLPTKEYNGKFPNDKWDYWCNEDEQRVNLDFARQHKASKLKAMGFIPVTKHWYEKQIGNIRFGVIVTEDEIKRLPKDKKFNIERCNFFYKGKEHLVIEVGECSGFNEEERKYFTEHQSEVMGSVIEVKCNEIFKDTGKMRHPRYLRRRPDKDAEQCVWKDHIGGL